MVHTFRFFKYFCKKTKEKLYYFLNYYFKVLSPFFNLFELHSLVVNIIISENFLIICLGFNYQGYHNIY